MLTKKQKEEFEKDNDGKKINSIDDLVLVHVTDYVPEGGVIHSPMDAGVQYHEEYDGVQYEVPRQRRTIHFAMNGDLTGTSNVGGSWKRRKYAIIIPLSRLNKEDFKGGTTVDFYSEDSIQIPEGSYILCPEEEKETVQKTVGNSVTVEGVEDEYINGYISILLQKLGYKIEEIGDYAWVSDGDDTSAIHVLKEYFENGKIGEIHSLSSEIKDELIKEDIIRTSIIAKILKDKNRLDRNSINKIFNDHSHMATTPNIFDKDEYFGTLLQSLNEIAGINIPKSVIDEIYNIKNGNITNQHIEDSMEIYDYVENKVKYEGFDFFRKKENNQYQCIAQTILRRRILGEIRLSQIKNIIEQNHDITFDELLEHFDDIVYDFTTEGRRSEFLDSMELDLSEVDKKVLSNKELKELYSEINEIKDIPYEQLSEEQKEIVGQFKKFYENENKNRFTGYRLTNLPKRDENGHLTMHMAIMRNDLKDLSPEEIQKIQSECIGVDEETALLNFETKMQGETTLSQYLGEYENYIAKLDEIMNERNKSDDGKDEEISVEDLGKQTLEEQKDTKAKNNMQKKLQEKMKAYTISQEKGEEK